MNLRTKLSGLFLCLAVGCVAETLPPPPSNPLSVCEDQARQGRCDLDRAGLVALCYANGPGPNPVPDTPGSWSLFPKHGCAAPKELNTGEANDDAGPSDRYTWEWQWWCCAPESDAGANDAAADVDTSFRAGE